MSKHCDHNFAIRVTVRFYPHRHFLSICISHLLSSSCFRGSYNDLILLLLSILSKYLSICSLLIFLILSYEHLIYFLLFHYSNPLFLCPTISLCLANGLLSSNLSIHTLLVMVGSAESSGITGLLLRKHISGCKKMLSISTLHNNKYIYACIEIYGLNLS